MTADTEPNRTDQSDHRPIPDTIYLQVHGNADPELYEGMPPDNQGVTWSDEPIYDGDEQYVNASVLEGVLTALEDGDTDDAQKQLHDLLG